MPTSATTPWPGEAALGRPQDHRATSLAAAVGGDVDLTTEQRGTRAATRRSSSRGATVGEQRDGGRPPPTASPFYRQCIAAIVGFRSGRRLRAAGGGRRVA